MNTYYVKLLLFTFLINILVLTHNENCKKCHNVSLIRSNTKRTIIKSRLLAQTQKHNPHYHNDPELKEIIDKLNDEAIKKYQQTHEPYEQLRELVEKNGRKLTGRNGPEDMSTLEKELLETYEEMFGEENHIMLKSGMNPNDDDRSDKSSSCECTDINNTELAKTKGNDKYLKHLKHRCTRGICFCSVSSAFLTMLGLAFAKAAAVHFVFNTCKIKSICLSAFTITNIFNDTALKSALLANATSISTCAGKAAGTAVGYATVLKSAGGVSTTTLTTCAGDAVGTAVSYTTAIFTGCGIAALVLLILAVVLIILYIWLYRRRKRSLKHECKKHLCR
ncbi:stevor PIR protein, putative [Plasmodium reichenowi]|uniref:Stevor PIR protein, putative n=1 Tax=Plasmodium reichenowi TaxID=5854 RepID=A0A2P9DSD5_PLARE|nr:stevor PIR protein, putative [Plasmodium reichenowi]